MQNYLKQYCKDIKERFGRSVSKEHSYRGDLQNLLENLLPNFNITNEPKRQACGAPDYIIQRGEIPIGYIETKDIGKNLDKTEKTDQLKRYLKSLDNLILTDYLEFRFYKYAEKVTTIKIAGVEKGNLKFYSENFGILETHLKDFCDFKGQTIKSIEKLAQMMAQKARMMEDVIHEAVKEEYENNSLKDQLKDFRRILIHDLDEKTFADIYAQTIAYGLFAARLHDKTLEKFSRQEARELIPRSNPFLRDLFDYISGAQLDDRVVWIVDDLCEIFRATDLQKLLSDFGKSTEQKDPFLHFYETFLDEYDPVLRKKRGVYYTPQPVVNFIVRAVDDILKNEFGLSRGIADTSKVTIRQDSGTIISKGKKKGQIAYEDIEVHKVQILDPGVGTGTFLAETIKQIHSKFKGQKGGWSSYVYEHLIPRLNGFEILMAPYAICHSKLEMLLKETGYKAKDKKKQSRFRVFLTNSLEEANNDIGNLFASWLSREATEANYIKKDTPLMVIIGNPPYSGESKNKGKWIMNLIKDYKKEPGGKEKLKERNSKWINDDYVKFLKFGQYLIEKNGEGVLAFINPHGFLDNPTFRGMRWNLLKTYNKIYILDLHGNVKKEEKALDNTKDENVFKIQQGVSINLFIKTGNKLANELSQVFHYDLYGNRKDKYSFLSDNSLSNIIFKKFIPIAPHFLFKYIEANLLNQYYSNFSVIDFFQTNVMGFQTHRDHFAIDDSKIELNKRLSEFSNEPLNLTDIENKYSIKNTSDFNIEKAIKHLKEMKISNNIIKCLYRPFENKYIYFNRIIVDRPRKELLKYVEHKSNILFGVGRQGIAVGDIDWCLTIISKHPVDANVFRRGGINLCPLYLYPDKEEENLLNDFQADRIPNLNMDIVNQITDKLGLAFTNEKEDTKNTFAPIDILDYIYAVLHSPSYREKYKEFLKIDFPRIPYPENKKTFWKLVKLGGELRTIHLLENPIVEKYVTTYPIDGNNEVKKTYYKDSKVYINKEQYFEAVPEVVWNFYIGGYQPAQKWLKDRKGRELNFDDILHYQKIIVVLVETDRLMKEIDKILVI